MVHKIAKNGEGRSGEVGQKNRKQMETMRCLDITKIT